MLASRVTIRRELPYCPSPNVKDSIPRAPWQVGMSFSGVPGGALRTESPSTIALHGCTSAGPKISSEVISFFPNRASWRMALLGNSAAAGLFTTFQLTRKSIINDISWSICLTDSGAEFGWFIVLWGERGDKDRGVGQGGEDGLLFC